MREKFSSSALPRPTTYRWSCRPKQAIEKGEHHSDEPTEEQISAAKQQRLKMARLYPELFVISNEDMIEVLALP